MSLHPVCCPLEPADAGMTSSLSLMRMCDKNMQQEDATVLESIHGYLESRLLLLNNIKVRLRSIGSLLCSPH